MAPAIRVLLPGSAGEALVPLPLAGLAALRSAAEQHFVGLLRGQEYVFTDTSRTFGSDIDVQQLQDGTTLVVAMAGNNALSAPARERISFQPHPKTLTMAGEFEYFAAQGRHPFVYALAEFVDNSLRATRRNAPRPRCITISLCMSGGNPSTARGLVAVQDNGCGMNKNELADWAVMNLSMEERGNQPQEPQPAGRGGAAGAGGVGRFLTGDLSFFGVGSKNAGFFMGSSIKVATKKAEELYVHELSLAAADLEKRYQNREEVYVEDMVHRNPADPSTLSAVEQPFSVAHNWVLAEAEDVAAGGTGPSFTRVVIGDLKPDVLRQIMDDEQGMHICQELAHLYHYYLHGEQGNRTGRTAGSEGRLPNNEPFPDIVLRYQVDSRVIWQRRLSEVDDDMETKLLRAQQAELPFTLQVPNKGTVSGVLYYYPYQNDHETVPAENVVTSYKPDNSPLGAAGGRPTQLGPSQMPVHATQRMPRFTQVPRGTQLPEGAGAAAAAGVDDDEDEDAAAGWQTAPIFEAFWQGRLIPGARIDTLPFLESVRQKRTAQAKDIIPDQAFRRLRGTLFFGPAFRVTRNKLLFRDNLNELLAAAVPGERQLEAKFKHWLQRCHATLDKSVRFEALADSRIQAGLRSKLGEENTAFERICDGSRTVAKGDMVRINAKPQVVGRVLHFTVPQAVREEGSYANGRVHVELVPADLYGPACEKQFSLRRLEAVLTEAEQQEHLQKELLKVASSLRLEPMRFGTGQVLQFSAGDTIPEVSVSVLNGGGHRIIKTAATNEKIVMMQRLWRLPAEGQPGGAGAGEAAVAEEAAGRAAKRQRKGRKGRGRQDENTDPGGKEAAAEAAAVAGEDSGIPAGAELLLTLENKTPIKDTFQFARINDGLQRSGSYALEFVATQSVPGQPPLRAVVSLAVAPGAPCSFQLSGEGKAVAALKDIALGEVLPPLKVVFSDQFGNLVGMQPEQTPPSLAISAALAGPGGELQPCEEVVVQAQQCSAEDCLLITELQLLGVEAAAAAQEPGAGLQLFAGGDLLSHPTARQAQAQPSKQTLPVAEVQLCVSLQGASNLEPVVLPLRLRAGAPQCLRLLPGHPWEVPDGNGEQEADGFGLAVAVQHGGSLPPFQVAVYDAWGNPTAPAADLGFAVLAECEATAPQAKEFSVNAMGMATVEGLSGASSTHTTGPATLKLSLRTYPTTPQTEAAVAAAGPTRALIFPLDVKPSVLPVAIQLVRDGQLLPTRAMDGEEGPGMLAVLEGVPAGSSVSGLRMLLLDGSGVPAAHEVTGRMTVSWRSGSKKATWSGEGMKLPATKVPDSVTEVSSEWVRFSTNEMVLETAIEIHTVPADPASWTLSLVDQLTSQNAEELGIVQCGKPFVLEVEALDSFNNRCAGGGITLPQPMLSLESEGPLQYNEEEWEQGWVSQGGERVYSARLAISGHPGPVRITVQDAGGEGGSALLAADTLTVELRAGPPAQLAVEGPATLELGTKAAIPQLRVRVCDAAGNPTTSETFEVSLNSSALATDGTGRAAAVTVSGGNKVKVKKGVAVFKDVRVNAEEAGSYMLRVQSASRKVAVQDAVLHLVMQPLNAVTDLRVLLPEAMADGCPAGDAAELHVAVLTENGLSLPADVAAGGLTLKVKPPGGGKADVVAYCLPADAEEGLQTDEGHYVFRLAELTAAGTYSAVAEYVESRPELAAGLSKKDATLRSASAQLYVHPGQPVTLSLEAAALPDKLAVTNGANVKQRLMLRNTAAQLQDCYGNAVAGGGVQVRFRLRHQHAAAAGDGSELPGLQATQGTGPHETDEHGRAFVGEISIAEGSGRALNGALDCELVCEALGLYPSSMHELETDSDGWAVCWQCPVLFSDDAARFAHIERLNQQRSELVQRRDALNERVGGAQQALAAAHNEQQKAQKALAEKRQAFGGPAPETLKAAEKQLAGARRQVEQQAAAEPEEALEARYGNPKHPMTSAVTKVLQSGDPGLVGVLAQLGTVDDPELSTILAAQLRSSLGVVVVQDVPARQRLSAQLAQQRYPQPDMLAMSMMVAYSGKTGDTPGFANAGQRAHMLQRTACSGGADPPLAIPLPHTRPISNMKDRGEGVGMGATDWPRGCLGYAVNLVRPVQRGHRATVLSSMLSSMLVFETLGEAESYREFLSMKLRTGCSTIVTLDGRRISGNGIVSGSSFVVPPLDRAEFRFGGSNLPGQNPAAAQAAEQVSLLEELVGALRCQHEADAAAAQAEGEVQQAEAECCGQLEAVEAEIAELEAQLALGDMAATAGGGGAMAAGQSGRKKRGKRQQQQQEQEAMAEEVAEEGQQAGEAIASGGKGKRRRMQSMRA